MILGAAYPPPRNARTRFSTPPQGGSDVRSEGLGYGYHSPLGWASSRKGPRFLGGGWSCRHRLVFALATVVVVVLGTPVQANVLDASQAGPFWAVAGSFLNRAAAQSAAQELTRKTGTTPTILVAITAAGQMHRVALGPWPATEAREAVRRLQGAGYTDAWKLAAADASDASNEGGERIGGASRTGGEGILPSHAPQGAHVRERSAQPPKPSGSETSATPAGRPRAVATKQPPNEPTSPLSYQADLRATAVFGTTDASPTKQKEELSLIAGIRADFGAPKALGLSAFHVTTRIRREGSDALVPGQPSSPSAVRHHLDAYAEAELRQAWIDLSRDDWRFRLGRQTVVWGNTTGLKVLDIVNPQSYREFLLSSFDSARTPLWMLNAERPVGQGTLQALLVLERGGHRLPRTGGVFAQPLYADRPKPPGRARYRDLEPGLRYSFAKDGWALTLNALRHRDDWPVWRLDQTGARAAFEPRMTTLGASAAKTYGDYSLRVETTLNDRRYFHGNMNDIHPSPEFASVVGVAWTALANTQIDLQFFQTSALDHAPGMLRDETEMTAVFSAERTFPTTALAASLTTHHGLSGQGALIRPRLTWQLHENLAITAFADLFEGRPTTFYGQFHHRDRVGLTLHLAK